MLDRTWGRFKSWKTGNTQAIQQSLLESEQKPAQQSLLTVDEQKAADDVIVNIAPETEEAQSSCQEKADTNINAVIGWAALFIGLTLDVATLLDNITDPADTPVFGTYSVPSFTIGMAISLYAAAGHTYCHWIQNKCSEPAVKAILKNGDSSKTPVSNPQKIASSGAAIAEASEIFVPFSLLQTVARLRPTKAAIGVISTGLGFWATRANLRTFGSNIQDYNYYVAKKQARPG